MNIHATQATRSGTTTLSDITAMDIEEIVHYWHANGDEHLDFLGIDRALLGGPENTRARYRGTIWSGNPNQLRIAFAIRLEGAIVGYTLLNRYAPEVNYSHWHIFVPHLRATGISTALYPHRIKLYFDLFPVTRLIHQTRTRNVGVNRMLDKYLPVAETRYIEKPDGVAGPGEFHLRYVHREDIPGLFDRAVRLASG